MAVLGSAAIVVLGTTIASYTNIDFNPIGFGFQLCSIAFEGIRLVMVQTLLSSEHRMGPLVLLYHLAPVWHHCVLADIDISGHECRFLHDF